MNTELLSRYNEEQHRVIEEYWDVINFTRRTGKVADGIRKREMTYWTRFPAEIVIQALIIHVKKYQNFREQYTRGIIRNLAREKEDKYGHHEIGKSCIKQQNMQHPGKHERNTRAADAFRNFLE